MSDATKQAKEAIKAARVESRKAKVAAETQGVPWSMVESTLESAANLWERASEACRLAGMDADASFCARQARALVA
jgi:hypothetical protein